MVSRIGRAWIAIRGDEIAPRPWASHLRELLAFVVRRWRDVGVFFAAKMPCLPRAYLLDPS